MKQAPIVSVIKPFSQFFKHELATGIMLCIAVIAAMLWANSPWSTSYFDLWHTPLGIKIGEFSFNKPLHIWINDGLMAIFFFHVGLEIKREIVAGELSTPSKAIMPVGAAIGGMLLPALIFYGFNYNEVSVDGWGVPMATDIAFTLGLISIVRTQISTSLKIFLTAVAVVDDLGAVLVIALFYTSHYSITMLFIALGFFLLLLIANYLGVRSTAFYAIVGITGLWLSFYYSGIHPTVAGILLAMSIPLRPLISKEKFSSRLKNMWSLLQKTATGPGPLKSQKEAQIIERLDKLNSAAHTPLQELEHKLTPWVYFVIMPVFAFANAGIKFENFSFSLFTSSISLGIIVGLVLGKTIGISGMTLLFQKLKIGKLEGVSKKNLLGISMLAGIGFTMSLFVTELAFENETFIQEAKVAILTASILAATLGLVTIKFFSKTKTIEN
tara:strand:+ start:905 stop:2227 length:1323 start_codon:yes stop_codon:yes gene_type:complete